MTGAQITILFYVASFVVPIVLLVLGLVGDEGSYKWVLIGISIAGATATVVSVIDVISQTRK